MIVTVETSKVALNTATYLLWIFIVTRQSFRKLVVAVEAIPVTIRDEVKIITAYDAQRGFVERLEIRNE